MHLSEIEAPYKLVVHLKHNGKLLYSGGDENKPVTIELRSPLYNALYSDKGTVEADLDSDQGSQNINQLCSMTYAVNYLEDDKGEINAENVRRFYENPKHIKQLLQLIGRVNEEEGFLG